MYLERCRKCRCPVRTSTASDLRLISLHTERQAANLAYTQISNTSFERRVRDKQVRYMWMTSAKLERPAGVPPPARLLAPQLLNDVVGIPICILDACKSSQPSSYVSNSKWAKCLPNDRHQPVTSKFLYSLSDTSARSMSLKRADVRLRLEFGRAQPNIWIARG